ncbi:MAG: LysR family transcriptional regulator [Oscillospiraceae bacterium]|nr:LysR family transcriptional regulator [Oscillospiraceae bacterium]
MDSRQVQFFLQACSDGSFNTAAKNLFISEQALSKAIKKLEQELGVGLFERHSKGIRLTEYGRAFQAEALAYLEHHEHIIQYFHSLRDPKPNSITIGIGDGLMDQWISKQLFIDFIHSHPDTEFNLFNFTEEDQSVRRYLTYHYDLLICSALYPSKNWKTVFRKSRPMRVVLSASHPLAQKKELTLKDLQHQYLAVASSETPMQKKLILSLQENGIRPNIRFSPSEIELINLLIHEAGLICFFGGDPTLVPEAMVLKDISDYQDTWDLYLLVPTESKPKKSVLNLIASITSSSDL